MPAKASNLLSNKIESLLIRRRVSKSELCRGADITRPTLDRWLSGESSPTLENLERLANALSIGVWEFLRPEQAKPSGNTDESRLLVLGALIAALAPLEEDELRAAADHLAALGLIDSASHAGQSQKISKS